MKHPNLFGHEELMGLLICFVLFLVFFTIQHFIDRLKTNKARRKYGNQVFRIFTWTDLWTILGCSAIAAIINWLLVIYFW
jgi:hypothetical protein